MAVFLHLLPRTTFAWSTTITTTTSALRRRSRCWSRLLAKASFYDKKNVDVSSPYLTHVLAGKDQLTVEETIGANLYREWDDTDTIPTDWKAQLSPRHLLQLGAIWLLPRGSSQYQKPQRLTVNNATQILQEEDYIRIHHTPRRFIEVYNYNWTAPVASDVAVAADAADGIHDKKGVVIEQGEGFWVINKPPNIPVHPTVDNVFENVADQVRAALGDGSYVSTPQRLDQNTSGLFVLARSKPFAAYYATLLSNKTDRLMKSETRRESAIQKGYKCLVCLIPTTSMAESYQQLQSFDILKHYLEPSVRAPKHYSRTIDSNLTWLESLLRVKSVSAAYPLVGSAAAEELSSRLFVPGSLPERCIGVVEVHVELLTGRTHQIRGQFAAEGYPLVGDAQYGGAIPMCEKTSTDAEHHYTHSEQLALQCTYLKFLDPDIVTKEDGEMDLKASNRWNEYSLEDCWWTPLLAKYNEQAGQGEATTSMEDLAQTTSVYSSNNIAQESRPELLPPQVGLSAGANKYILIKATKEEEVLWFVKSATPSECGGPYHANVAQDLVDWLQALSYDVLVTGGGRIDYQPSTNSAHIYGFSYGFGKGDHAKVASLIEQHTDIIATYDNSDSLY